MSMISADETCYVIERNDYTKLYAISVILCSGDYLDDKQRRDLGHRIYTIIENATEVIRDDKA